MQIDANTIYSAIKQHEEKYHQDCPNCEKLKLEIENWKTYHDAACKDAKQWRRDAQELQGTLKEIKLELQSRDIHLLAKHCWCNPQKD